MPRKTDADWETLHAQAVASMRPRPDAAENAEDCRVRAEYWHALQ